MAASTTLDPELKTALKKVKLGKVIDTLPELVLSRNTIHGYAASR